MTLKTSSSIWPFVFRSTSTWCRGRSEVGPLLSRLLRLRGMRFVWLQSSRSQFVSEVAFLLLLLYRLLKPRWRCQGILKMPCSHRNLCHQKALRWRLSLAPWGLFSQCLSMEYSTWPCMKKTEGLKAEPSSSLQFCLQKTVKLLQLWTL